MTDANAEQTTVIAPGTTINGDMTFSGPTSVLGQLNGTITSTDRIEVGRDAKVAAEITAENVLVDGAIEGDVNARDKLQLNSTAHLTGDVNARTLIVSEGASFIGHCKVGAGARDISAAPTRRAATDATTDRRVVSESKPLTDSDGAEQLNGAQLQHAS